MIRNSMSMRSLSKIPRVCHRPLGKNCKIHPSYTIVFSKINIYFLVSTSIGEHSISRVFTWGTGSNGQLGHSKFEEVVNSWCSSI